MVAGGNKTCTYSTYQWNTKSKTAVNFHRVQHNYSSLKTFEVDKLTGCSVCEEDQISIKIGQLKTFKICKILAKALAAKLTKLVAQGQPIQKLVGSRVGMTKGQVEDKGNRTQFSNHSFGIALDINDEQNGLYDRCVSFGPQCRLRKGGEWDPRFDLSLTAQSPIVLAMKKLGFKWGGEIKGKQKDFMHFSPSGY